MDQELLQLIHNAREEKDIIKLQSDIVKYEDFIVRNHHLVDSLLDKLDNHKHSFGVLFLLNAKSKLVSKDFELFITQCSKFLHYCMPSQVRLDPKKFKFVCLRFMEVCKENKQPIRAILPLQVSIKKIGTSELITPQHYMFVLSCIQAKCYKAALPVIDHFVYEIDPSKTAIEAVETRLYFYYGGMAFIALRQFEKALEYFDIVISAPALVGSAIMVGAYKKFVVISLILKGEVPSLPKYTNPSITRTYKHMCQPYEELSKSFSTRSVEDLLKTVEDNKTVFTEDANMGIVKQAVQALYRQNIERLTKTYLTLSFKDITHQVGLPNIEEAERRIFRMIEKGEVFAKINQKVGMIEFLEDPEQYNNYKTCEYLDNQISKTIHLTNSISNIHESVSTSQAYLHKVLQMERGAPSSNPRGGSWMGQDEMMIDSREERERPVNISKKGYKN